MKITYNELVERVERLFGKHSSVKNDDGRCGNGYKITTKINNLNMIITEGSASELWQFLDGVYFARRELDKYKEALCATMNAGWLDVDFIIKQAEAWGVEISSAVAKIEEFGDKLSGNAIIFWIYDTAFTTTVAEYDIFEEHMQPAFEINSIAFEFKVTVKGSDDPIAFSCSAEFEKFCKKLADKIEQEQEHETELVKFDRFCTRLEEKQKTNN